jgi:hypothetical protein
VLRSLTPLLNRLFEFRNKFMHSTLTEATCKDCLDAAKKLMLVS